MKRARVTDIITIASNISGIPVEDIKGKRRFSNLVNLRQAIVIVARMQYPEHSFPRIGRFLDRDHTTLIHLFNRERDAECDALVAELAKRAEEAAVFVPPMLVAAKLPKVVKPVKPPPLPLTQEQKDELAGDCFLASMRKGSALLLDALQRCAA